MIEIPLQPLPNQSFFITLDNNQWGFTLKTTNGVISASVSLNGVEILSNMRCVANQVIIPSLYEESGNFLFLTQNFQLPEYTQFGITQRLVYITASELSIFRGEIAPPITQSDFSPLAAIPTRFEPSGYNLAPYSGSKVWFNAENTALGNVTTWTDLSGNGHDATTAAPPVCTADLLNGKRGLVFNGSSKFLATAAFAALTQPTTIFVVSQITAGLITPFSNYMIDGITSGNRNAIFLLGDGRLYQTYAGTLLPTSTRPNTAPHVHMVTFNGGSTSYYLDGLPIITGAAGSNTLTGLTIGSRYNQDVNSFFHGNIFEVMVYNQEFTTQERNYMFDYFGNGWGVPIS